MSFVIFGARSQPRTNRNDFQGATFNLGLECQGCERPAAATVLHLRVMTFNTWEACFNRFTKEPGSYPNGDWNLLEFWPPKKTVNAPDHLPAAVERAFVQGERNLLLGGCEEPAATMFRRSLDLALKMRFPDLSGDLNKKIKALAQNHTIPKELEAWAHEIRGIGNDGAHDLEGCTQADAEAARDFADALLRYLFTLPEMIARRRPTPAVTEDGSKSD